MTLRNVSIGLSAAVLLGIYGFWIFLILSDSNPLMLLIILFIVAPFIISSVFPQIVSIVISVYSKHLVSHIIAATISVLHGLFFAVACIHEVWLYLPFSGILLMPVLLPLGLTAIIIEIYYRIYYRKKNQKVRTEP
jgi:hypothetical protein